ncbi:hypothetical protein MTR_6g071980 [Medicago truncatula]|uniref:Transmembrane protein n=1 Tax=Medicago truncatula TaxID=3880 RepID=G7KHV8_MEDTR|nr:hypothetical protein MTR_6g071980 [Medicago truncatula]
MLVLQILTWILLVKFYKCQKRVVNVNSNANVNASLQVLFMFLGCYKMAPHSPNGPLNLVPKMVISQ